MKMSGRPATMFRPEIINQLRVLEFVLHLLGQLRLPTITKSAVFRVRRYNPARA